MSAPRHLRIKNLDKHQHYKDRRPPWIKLHAAVLDDYAFACLQDASKAHLMLLWVLASQCDNRLPDDPRWLAQKIGATEPVDVGALVSAGFIERCDAAGTVVQDASTVLAAREHFGVPETETETEGEAEKKPSGAPAPKRRTRAPKPAPAPAAPPAAPPSSDIGAGKPFGWADAVGLVKEVVDRVIAPTPEARIAALIAPSLPAEVRQDPARLEAKARELRRAVLAFGELKEADNPIYRGKYTLDSLFRTRLAECVALGNMPYSDANGLTARGLLQRWEDKQQARAA